jgi:hypothetical protein
MKKLEALSYEDLTDRQKAVLDLAVFEGQVLVVGQRMAGFVQSAKMLVRKGILMQEDGTRALYKPTLKGRVLYEKRQRR